MDKKYWETMPENTEDCEDNQMTFEDFKKENGITYWWATDLMCMLGYKDMKSFHKALDRATKAFVSLGIAHYENIIPVSREKEDGTTYQDFKLSRFGCYITVMNGDPKKEEVALAQAYFAQNARKFELHMQNNEQFDRLIIRDELTEGTKVLSAVAKGAGVQNFASFVDAGYRGLYNMQAYQLKAKRGLKKEANLADYMGRTELAANLFRVTQTEERIKSQKITGQNALEATHFKVGREVRTIVQQNTGTSPESLQLEKQLPEVKKELKAGYKKMTKGDSKPAQKPKRLKGDDTN